MLIHAIALVSVALPQSPAPPKPLDPALTELSKFVGGTWVGEGKMPIQQEWTWNRDKRGLTINTTIGKGTPKERLARAFLGWDPVAKKPYYLDMHDSETTYYGHLYLTDGTVEFKFGQIGSGKIDWIERGKCQSFYLARLIGLRFAVLSIVRSPLSLDSSLSSP